MVAVMLMGVAAIVLLCIAAYTLATYTLPFMLGLTAARFAYHTGSGLIGAGFVGLLAGAVAFGVLVFLFETLRPPILRLAVALVFAVPAVIAGYALIHGITRDAVPSEIWRQIFCVIGGLVVGVSALLKLAAPGTERAAQVAR